MGDATLEITQVDNDSQLKSQNKSMKVEILDWKTVGYWVWDIKDEDDICGICQNAFDGVCGTCDEPGEQCPLLFGTCSHIFHMHCIIRWTEKMQPEPLCPLCKRKWEEVTADESQAVSSGDDANSLDMQENVPQGLTDGDLSTTSLQ